MAHKPVIDRRQVLTGGAAALAAGAGLAALAHPRAVKSATSRLRDQVSILEFCSPRDPPAAIARGFASAYAAGRTVEVPAGVRLFVDSALRIPAGRDLVMNGVLRGIGPRAAIEVEGTSILSSSGGLFDDIPIHLRSGGPRLIGYRGRGRSHTALILIEGRGSYRDLVIDDWQVSDCNYGILRQGRMSSLAGARISNGRAQRLMGDAVNFNICPRDSRVAVAGLEIDTIDTPPGQRRVNWGIGVAFAGLGYDPTWPDGKAVKDFTISGIRGRSLRQLVHVENGHRFEISDIVGEDISTAYSRNNGLECATVICYGCKGFSINNVVGRSGPQAGIYARFGLDGSGYAAPCRDFTISNVNLDAGHLLIEPGTAGGYAIVRDAILSDGTFTCIGQTDRMTFERIRARRRSGAAVEIVTSGVGDRRDRFRSAQSQLQIADMVGVDGNGRRASVLRLAPNTRRSIAGSIL